MGVFGSVTQETKRGDSTRTIILVSSRGVWDLSLDRLIDSFLDRQFDTWLPGDLLTYLIGRGKRDNGARTRSRRRRVKPAWAPSQTSEKTNYYAKASQFDRYTFLLLCFHEIGEYRRLD